MLKRIVRTGTLLLILGFWLASGGEALAEENTEIEEIYSSELPEESDPETIVKNGWIEEEGGLYYYIDDVRQTGWLKLEDGTYFLNENGAAVCNRWLQDGGNWYYLNNEYQMVKNSWQQDSKGWCYLLESGKAVKNQWLYIGDNWYYFKADYHMVTSAWQQDSKGWCYLLESGRAAKNEWIQWSGGWYYLEADCHMAVNVWQKDSSGWCYLLESGKAAKNQWIKWKGDWYYLKADCHMAANAWQQDSSGWCYLLDNGKLAKSKWVKWQGKWYYLNSSGHMATNQWLRDGNAFYWVNASGVNTLKHDSFSKAQAYTSNTQFLILVDRNVHFVTIYQGSKSHWALLMGFACGDGKASTPTITGQFSIPSKYPRSHPYFDSGSARCWYPTRITGGYLFHSVLYYQTGSPSRIMDGTLGRGVSHGCVRLALNNAKWIYDSIPIGTKVVIY